MFKANSKFKDLSESFLFTEIADRTDAYCALHPNAKIIKVGIGDIVRPIVPSITAAMLKAVEEMGSEGGYHGYGPEVGYPFLRNAIVNQYKERGMDFSIDEIFVSCGTKCDTSNVQELFSRDCKVAVTDPVYPVYVETNVIAGRAGKLDPATGRYSGLTYLPCVMENDFVPELPKAEVDVIYLCYPNNPTGTALTRAQLQDFVDYANKVGAIILFDAAYEAFVRDADVPRSIFELPGARECAIEFRSFSKLAGFTGTRLAFAVVPKTISRRDADGAMVSLNALYNRRHCLKYNGAPYIVQRGAEAALSPQGQTETMAEIDYYLENARIMKETLLSAGYKVFGGVNSPYIWIKSDVTDSWALFDKILNDYQIVGAPGSGFGVSGRGYFRFSAFNSRSATIEAMERLTKA